MNKHEPLFSCTSCAEFQSWPADDLRQHGGELWCADCWDNIDIHEWRNSGCPEYSDLPQFIPEADQKIQALERERNELAAQVERLKHERDEALTLVIRYQSLLECAIRGEEIIVGDAIVIGIDAELADEIEESFDESPKAALAALKAQWQADAVREVAADIREMTAHHTQYSVSLMACRVDGMADSIERIEEVRQRTQEAGNVSRD